MEDGDLHLFQLLKSSPARGGVGLVEDDDPVPQLLHPLLEGSFSGDIDEDRSLSPQSFRHRIITIDDVNRSSLRLEEALQRSTDAATSAEQDHRCLRCEGELLSKLLFGTKNHLAHPLRFPLQLQRIQNAFSMHGAGQDAGVLDVRDAEPATDAIGVALQLGEEIGLLKIRFGSADSEDQSRDTSLEVDAADHRSFLQMGLDELEAVVVDKPPPRRVDDEEGANRSQQHPIDQSEQYQREGITQEYDGEQDQ